MSIRDLLSKDEIQETEVQVVALGRNPRDFWRSVDQDPKGESPQEAVQIALDLLVAETHIDRALAGVTIKSPAKVHVDPKGNATIQQEDVSGEGAVGIVIDW